MQQRTIPLEQNAQPLLELEEELEDEELLEEELEEELLEEELDEDELDEELEDKDGSQLPLTNTLDTRHLGI